MVRGDYIYSSSIVVCFDYATVCKERRSAECEEELVAVVVGVEH